MQDTQAAANPRSPGRSILGYLLLCAVDVMRILDKGVGDKHFDCWSRGVSDVIGPSRPVDLCAFEQSECALGGLTVSFVD